jgi:hypothetical protein
MDSKYFRDLVERVAMTFVAAFLGAVTITSAADWGDLTMWQSAASAGGAAVFTLIKGIVASQRGDSSSASLSRKV